VKIARLKPIYWGILFFILAQVLTFITIARENPFLEELNISVPPQAAPTIVQLWPTVTPTTPGVPVEPSPSPASTLGPLLIYFAGAVVVLGVVLFLVPISMLRLILRAIFALLFAWGIFVFLVFWLHAAVALAIAIVAGVIWYLLPRVWLHDVVMIFAMVSVGAVFGRFLTPWTSIILMLILAIYDFLAVRFGFMIWMAKRLSDAYTLPAFVLPQAMSEWNANLKQSSVTRLVEEKPSEREFSILGGGDVGFPLLLVTSTYFAYGFNSAIFMAGFSFVGLICVYWIQSAFLKGKPMPGLPPITALSLIALLIITFTGSAFLY
jgi:presenilin-like A22 family membrane protease